MKSFWLKRGMYWTLKNNTIYYYYNDSKNRLGIYTEESKRLFSLLELLKIPVSFDVLLEKNPFESEKDLNEALNFLLQEGFIYYENSNEYETTYEKRIANYIGKFPKSNYYNFKKDVKKISTCLIGVGTAGSYIPEVYFKMGFNNLTIIDNDYVEEHNLISQNFFRSDLSQSKVSVLEKRYSSTSKNNCIKAIQTKVESFEHLCKLVNIQSTDYILLFADDYELTLDIIKKAFDINPNISIILSGYSSFEVENLLIHNENKDVFIQALDQDLLKFKSLEGLIVENSGSILDSFYIAFGTLKILIDHAINLNNTEYAVFNHLNNDSFIGSIFEFNLLEKNNYNRIKSLLYNENKEIENNDINWMKQLTLENLNENNKLNNPEIDKMMHNYIYLEKFDMNSFNKILSYKNQISENSFQKNDINKNKNALLIIFQKYLTENFHENIVQNLNKIIKNGYLYTNQNLHGNKDYVTLKSNESISIYCPLTDDIDSLNYLIHELLHAVFYLNGNDDTYEHEEFVYRHHMKFLREYSNIPLIAQLKDVFIYKTMHNYLTYSISCEYEKYTYLDKIEEFHQMWMVENDELYYILSNNICRKNILQSYKYIYAINQNIQIFISLLSNDQNKVKESIS